MVSSGSITMETRAPSLAVGPCLQILLIPRVVLNISCPPLSHPSLATEVEIVRKTTQSQRDGKKSTEPLATMFLGEKARAGVLFAGEC